MIGLSLRTNVVAIATLCKDRHHLLMNLSDSCGPNGTRLCSQQHKQRRPAGPYPHGPPQDGSILRFVALVDIVLVFPSFSFPSLALLCLHSRSRVFGRIGAPSTKLFERFVR